MLRKNGTKWGKIQKYYIFTIVININGDLDGNDSRNDGCS
jgi:hypothetical protein